MFSNWVDETTSTTGTGAVTLSGAESNASLAFSDYFSDNSVVRYFIKNSDNREEGMGVISGSGATLTRTKVIRTLVSGTLDDSSPVAITLVGSSEVFIATSGDSVLNYSPINPATAYRVSDSFDGTWSSTVGLTADRLYAVPFTIKAAITPTSLGGYVLGASGAKIRFGIADLDENNAPNQLLCETGEIAVETSNTFTASVACKPLPAGMYYCLILTNQAISMHGVSSSNAFHHLPVPAQGNGRNKLYNYGAFTYGAIPTDIGSNMTTWAENTNAPIVRWYS